jgi:ABC-2 type transport system permease protein
MMTTWAVWITSLKAHLGLSLARYYLRRRDVRFLAFVGVPLAVGVAVAPQIYLYQRLLNAAYNLTLPLGQTPAILTLSMVTAASAVLFLGFAYVMSVFYFSNDLPLLITLPLSPWQVLSGKFLVVLVAGYLTAALFLLPGFLVYGIRSGAGSLYWLQSLAVYLVFPLIPVSLAALAVMLLMRAANLARYKDAVRLIGMLVLVLAIAVFGTLPARMGTPQREAEFLARLLLPGEGLMVQVGQAFPPAVWATRALTAPAGATRLGWLLALAGGALGTVAIAFALGQWLFYGGLIGSEEVRRGRGLTEGVLARRLRRVRAPVWAIALRDIRLLVREPMSLLNSVAMIPLLPVLMAIPILAVGEAAQPSLQDLLLGAPLVSQLAGVGYVAAMALMAPAASSAFSREGRLFWVSRTVPVDPRVQVQGKLTQAYLIMLLTLPVLALMGMGVAGWGGLDFLVVAAAGMAASLPLISLSLLIDILRPYLTWQNPVAAIKENLNVLLAMALGGALIAGQGLAVMRLLGAGLGLTAALAAVAGASLLVGAGVLAMLLRVAPACYQRIEI